MSVMPGADDLFDVVPRPWMVWVKLAVAALVVVLAGWVIWKLFFADIQRRVAGEKGGRVVAEHQVEAEANIADRTIENVHTREVYREHVTNIVTKAQEEINRADEGQQMDPAIDAAAAAGLCRLRDSLCRRPAAPEEVQPVREPVPGADGAR